MADGTHGGDQVDAPCPQDCDGRPLDAPACDDCVARYGYPTRWREQRMRPAWVADDDDETISLVEPRVTRRGLVELLTIGGATTYAIFKAPRGLLALRARIPGWQVISVGTFPDDDCETISEALAVAGPEATVVVAEGTYRESLVVRNGVTIKPVRGHHVEIAPPHGPAITVVGGDPLIRNLTLRAGTAPTGGAGGPPPAILVTGGAPTIRDCQVHWSDGDGIRVQGVGATAHVAGTQVSGAGGECRTTLPARAGVWFDDGTAGTVEKCTVNPSGATWIGVQVGNLAAPVVRDTKVTSDPGGIGVRIGPGGAGTFERCTVEARVGMSVHGGLPSVRETVFTGCAVGLEVRGPGGGTYEGCTLDAWSPAVDLWPDASPVLDRCTVTARGAAIVMHPEANPVVRRTSVVSMSGESVVAEVSARGRFEGSALGNANAPEADHWQVDPDRATVSLQRHASTWFEDCTIVGGPGSGVDVAELGGGAFVGCRIDDHDGPGMVVGVGAHPVVRGGSITRNGGDGVRVLGGGKAILDGCTIAANLGSGLRLEAGANPVVRACRFHDNGRHGVDVRAAAAGRITGCTLAANAFGDWSVEVGARAQVFGNAPDPA